MRVLRDLAIARTSISPSAVIAPEAAVSIGSKMDTPPAADGQRRWRVGGIVCALSLGLCVGLLPAPPIFAEDFPAPIAARPKGPNTNTYPTGSGSLIDKAPPKAVVVPPEAPGEEPVYETLPPKRLFDGRPIPVGDPLEHP